MTYPYNLGRYTRAVTTKSAEAQLWFDRGLNWLYGFNHDEAIVCFDRAAAADPDCAMAHWGHAYAAGPDYNMPWDRYDERGLAKALASSFDASQKALALVDQVSPIEAALIKTLPARYPQRSPLSMPDMALWDQAFADEMRALHKAYPDDADIRSVCVDALLNLTPWKMWDIQSGQPASGAATVEAREILEVGMAAPGGEVHPGLLHFYIHLMEMSPTPEVALKASDTLRELMPDAGHIVHMGAHIDVLCGHYENVVRWNEKAVEADLIYYNAEGAFNVYTGYRQHNYHFVIAGALFLGQFEPAMRAVEGMGETTPYELLQIQSPPMADFFEIYVGLKPHVYIRFGMWDEILEMELPEDREIYCCGVAFIEYAKGLAHSALGNIEQAEAQLEIFLKAKATVPESRLMHNVIARDLFEIATQMLLGELAYRKGDYDVAFDHLRQAVQLDDALPYDEPWGWMQPTRHALGALLFEQGHLAEAEQTFREDLGLASGLPRACVHPDNVWALRGLYDCLVARNDTVELPHVELRLKLAEARADRPIKAACGCAQVAMTKG